MKRVIVFPGQGSQQPGMGKELAQTYASARQVFEEVDDALGQKLSELMFEGPEEELTLTENAQPAIMASSIAILTALEKEFGFKPVDYADYYAGHSLGEYTALRAAHAFSLADTARLLKLRGQAMQKAVPEGQGAMAALLGCNLDKANKLVAQVTQFGICAVANDNSPEQVVISGARKVIQQAVALAETEGVKKAVMLQVSAPFHCSLMEPAARPMQEALEKVQMQTLTLPIIANVTAEAVHDTEQIRSLLVRQVSSPVRWRESVLFMAQQGVTHTLELGAGKVLSGLIRRTEPAMETTCVSQAREMEAFVKSL